MSEEIRIGVFVCHCGNNIGGCLDVPKLTEYARTLPPVVYAKDNMYTCSDAGLKEIQDAIKERKLNRVVVAACTPRTHEPLFREACQDAGLNPYLFDFANIRDQCSWVHMDHRHEATEKAKDLIRMSVARAALLRFQEHVRVNVRAIALVIGGGPAGMSAALNLANRGFKVELVEKQDKLGGMLRHLHKLYPTHMDAEELMNGMIEKVRTHRNIEVLTNARVTGVNGFIGNFEVMVRQGKNDVKLGAGVIIVATGGQVLKPEGMYGYDGEMVITQLELDGLFKRGGLEVKDVVMIQCVGARSEEREYCSRTCCTTAIKNAALIKQTIPGSYVYILYRDIQTYGSVFEEYYASARHLGVMFIKYVPERPPQVTVDSKNHKGFVMVYDDMLGEHLGINFDLLVLSAPVIPNDDAVDLSQMLKVPVDKFNFFLESHIKLSPLDFSVGGIYLCGNAHWPSHSGEAISQGCGAAMRASAHLARGYVEEEPLYASVDRDKCIGCRLCQYSCAYGAPSVEETEEGLKVKMTEVLCKGCGLCGATCPAHAITMHHFMDEQIEAQIMAGLGVA